jgi:acyl-CoA thioester hydrolase
MTVNITEIRVRYSECDPMGVVHHTVYPVWFEMGRTELLRMTGVSYRDLEEQGILLAVVRLEARYRQPARYDEVLQLETSLASVGRVKVEHTYRLLRGDELLATGATTLACLDQTGQARVLPDMLLAPQPDSG